MQLSLQKVAVPAEVVLRMAREALRPGGACTDLKAFVGNGHLQIFHSIDTGPHGALRHVSISLPDRYPTWEEIKAVRARFFDKDEDVMMVLPREEDYVNIHENCFHLWQVPSAWAMR